MNIVIAIVLYILLTPFWLCGLLYRVILDPVIEKIIYVTKLGYTQGSEWLNK